MSMHFARFDFGVGVLHDGRARHLPWESMSELLRHRRAAIRQAMEEPSSRWFPEAEVTLQAPIDGRMEVWAAGVTYERSLDARVEESTHTGALSTVYDRVYAADRPELFFKAAAWRVVTEGQPIMIRADAAASVPEPELAVVANCFGEPVGVTICDDMTARTIEGDNPLYLPQAKIYDGACGLARKVLPWWELPPEMRITMEIHRGGPAVFTGETSTARLRRTPEELLGWLFREQSFPDGVILSTGTGIVPPLDFTLAPGDEVTIAIEGVGVLRQRVEERGT